MRHLAIKEIFYHKREWIKFFTFQSLGMGIFLAVLYLTSAFTNYLDENSKNILLGDLKISQRRLLTESEKSIITSILPKDSKVSETISCMSMVRTDSTSRLVTVMGVDKAYPLISTFIDNGKSVDGQPSDGTVWLEKPLKSILNISENDSVKIGNRWFAVERFYDNAPGLSLGFTRFGYGIYMTTEDFTSIGLIQKGSRINHTKRFLFSKEFDGGLEERKEIMDQLNTQLDDPEVRVEAAGVTRSNFSRNFDIVLGFLKLTALLSWILASIGAWHFFHALVRRTHKNSAWLQMIGARTKDLFTFYAWQIVVVLSIGTMGGVLLSIAFGKGFEAGVSALYDLDLNIFAGWGSGLVGLVACLFFLSMLMLYTFVSEADLDIPVLLRGGSASLGRVYIIFGIVMSLFLYGSAWLTTKSFYLTLQFMVLTIGSWIVLAIVILGILWYLKRLKNIPLWFHVFKSLLFLNKGATVFISVLIAWVLLILHFFISLDTSIGAELNVGENSTKPSWFLVDIQPDQKEELSEFLEKNSFEPKNWSPMIRARLKTVNGIVFEKEKEESETVEEERKRRFRNRGFNLSYRQNLSQSETILEGKWNNTVFSGDGLPDISVEDRFAQRLDLKMNDTLTFDIEGIEISGIVRSIRKIDWTRWTPNFFVLMQPGVLEEAPHTELLSLQHPPTALSGKSHISKSDFQFTMAKDFPNITVIDIFQQATEVTKLLNKFTTMINLLTYLMLTLTVLVAYLILADMLRGFKNTLYLLELIGQDEKSQQRWIIKFFFAFIAFSSLFGWIGGVLITKLVLTMSWEMDITLTYSPLIINMFGAFVLSWILQKTVSREEIPLR